MKKTVFSTLLFDFDGTIIDSMPDILSCMKKAYSEEGITDVALKPEHIGPPLIECLKEITPGLDNAVLEKVGAHFRKAYDSSTYPNTRIYIGVRDTLELLKAQNIKLYLVTNKREIPTLRLLKILKLEYFLVVVSPDINKDKKMNKTEMIAYLMKKEKINAAEALYAGDTVTDIQSAHANGLKVAAVTYGYNTKERLIKAGAEFIMDNFRGLLEITGTGKKDTK
ncbi:MAG: hypothetical protein A2044_00690 [Candidatus Firestonebacteria bacterium GWA2_43_8]|nr:MAG: hypothetical protein A2044_00690 [Candidatus Firestonebacteria bacterium GWA2_43_8]